MQMTQKTLTLPKLKCNTCGILIDADEETVQTTINTCKRKYRENGEKCGIRQSHETLRGIQAELHKRGEDNVRRLDANKVSHYPHRKCRVCNVDVANAARCGATLAVFQNECELAEDAPKKQLPVLLTPQPHRHIRDVIAQAKGLVKETPVSGKVVAVDRTKLEFEFEIEDPINVLIDKKGVFHYRAVQ